MCEQIYIEREEREGKRQTNFHQCSYPVVAYVRIVYYMLLISGFNGCCLTGVCSTTRYFVSVVVRKVARASTLRVSHHGPCVRWVIVPCFSKLCSSSISSAVWCLFSFSTFPDGVF